MVRHPRGVDLTPAGHAFLREARLAFEHIARATGAAVLIGAPGGARSGESRPLCQQLARAARALADAAAPPRRRLNGPGRLAMTDPPMAGAQPLTWRLRWSVRARLHQSALGRPCSFGSAPTGHRLIPRRCLPAKRLEKPTGPPTRRTPRSDAPSRDLIADRARETRDLACAGSPPRCPRRITNRPMRRDPVLGCGRRIGRSARTLPRGWTG